MLTLSITDTVLSQNTLMAKSERIQGASIFPFFGKSGQVQQLMLLLPDSRTVCMIPFKKGLAKVSYFGVIKLSMDLAEIESYSHFTPNQVAHLNHYDPAWLLSHKRFASYWAKTLIKKTNCAGYLKQKVRNVIFSRDLALLERGVMAGGYLNNFRTITPEMVLQSIPPTPFKKSKVSSNPVNSGWHLDPIWNHWSNF